MTAMGEARAAGWYQDPLSAAHSRWWDGSEWTQLTQPLTADTIAFPTAVPTPVSGPVPSGAPPAGWFPDPGSPHFQRYWDGAAWTSNVAPVVHGGGTTVIVNGRPPKSVGLAFVLTFFFGPLGVFYSSITGGLVLTIGGFFVGLIFALVTLGFGLFVYWPALWIASIVWGCVAASSPNPTTVIHR